MDIQDIINYVLETPENTNPAILRGMIEQAVTSGSGESITVEPLSVTENDVYTAPSGKAYSPVTVNVQGGSSYETVHVAVSCSLGEEEEEEADVDFTTESDSQGMTTVVRALYSANDNLYSAYDFILYNGETATWNFMMIGESFTLSINDSTKKVTATGDASVSKSGNTSYITVTGDCSLLIETV